MLHSLCLHNFTVYPDANLTFGKNLNIVIGENGTGKSHLLKLAYSVIAVNAEKHRFAQTTNGLNKSDLEKALAEKLLSVFLPDGLGRLVRRQQGRNNCALSFVFDNSDLNINFRFSTVSKSSVKIERMPKVRFDLRPVFLPTRELLTVAPGFVSLYESTQLPFDETWRDTCVLLEALPIRGARQSDIKQLLEPLEQVMGGTIATDKTGRFYLFLKSGIMEMHLVAEGMRKVAMIARLIATGSLLGKGYLFWDEPESNLNPKLIKKIARTILHIANSGVQVFIATHSLFLMRELHILQKQEFPLTDRRCFGFHKDENGVSVTQGSSMEDIGDITALDEDLKQSERYIDTEMGLELQPTVTY